MEAYSLQALGESSFSDSSTRSATSLTGGSGSNQVDQHEQNSKSNEQTQVYEDPVIVRARVGTPSFLN